MPRSRAARVLFSLVVAACIALGVRVHAQDVTDPIPVLPGKQVLGPQPGRLSADPSSIGNFSGLVALAYLRGKVRDASGHRWLMQNDIRVMQGDYVSADGTRRHGTFAFV